MFDLLPYATDALCGLDSGGACTSYGLNSNDLYVNAGQLCVVGTTGDAFSFSGTETIWFPFGSSKHSKSTFVAAQTNTTVWEFAFGAGHTNWFWSLNIQVKIYSANGQGKRYDFARALERVGAATPVLYVVGTDPAPAGSLAGTAVSIVIEGTTPNDRLRIKVTTPAAGSVEVLVDQS